VLFAYGAHALTGPIGTGLLHGMILILYSTSTQIAAILLGAVAGTLVCRTSSAVSTPPMSVPISRRIGVTSLAIFLLLLFGLPLVLSLGAHPGLALFNAFYRSAH